MITNILFGTRNRKKYSEPTQFTPVGMDDYDLFESKEEADYLRNTDVSVVKNGEVVDIPVENLTTKEGIRSFHTRKFPIYDDNNQPIILLGCFDDISQRIRTERALIQSEENYKKIIENLTDIFYKADIYGKIILASPSCIDIFGLSSIDEVFGHSIESLYKNPSERDDFVALLKKTGKVKNYRAVMLKNDGTEVFVETTANIILDNDGNYAGVEGIVRDITDRKKAEQALKESEEKYRLLFENMTNGFQLSEVVYDENNNPVDFKILAVNKYFSDFSGLDYKEVVGKTIKEVYPTVDIEMVDKYNSVAITGEPIQYEYFSKTFNKYVKFLAFSPQKGQFACIYEDISKQKNAEKALKESEEKFRLMLKNSNDIFVLVNKHGEQFFISDIAKNITGYTPEELKGSLSNVIYSEDLDLVLEHWNDVLSNKEEIFRVQYRHKHKEKGFVWLEAVAQNLLDNPSINAVISNVRDISYNKETEKLLIEREKQLQQLNVDKDRFMSILAHDLKSPFNAILGLSELLSKNIHRYDIDKIEDFSNRINKSAQSTYALLENLLMWSRLNAGSIPFEPQKMNFAFICTETIETLTPIADSKSITINYLAANEVTLSADAEMLKIVLRNLISNAIKFTKNGGRIDVYAEQGQNIVTITVSDNGIGIGSDEMSKLFDPTQMFTTTGTANEKGTGLGLLLCKEFVEKHSGKIWVESVLGKGSAFIFMLPR